MHDKTLELVIDTSACHHGKWVLASNEENTDIRELIRDISNSILNSQIEVFIDNEYSIELICSGEGLAYLLYRLSLYVNIDLK